MTLFDQTMLRLKDQGPFCLPYYPFMAIGKARHNSRIQSSLRCMQGALRVVLCTKKLNFVSQNWRKENEFVACGFSSIEIHVSDNKKSLISRINELCVFFNKISP